MSLADKIRKAPVKSVEVEIDGVTYRVTGKLKSERGRLIGLAKRKDGTTNFEKLENIMLEACVCDAEDGSTATQEDWSQTSSHITGPLVARVMTVCGMDKDDLGPKHSDSTES